VTIKRRAFVDTKRPQTSIVKHPRKKTRRQRTRFKFESSEPRSTFECSLDDQRFKSCESPERFRVGVGEHKFEVRATDRAGNVEKRPASFEWTVKQRKRR
jgi:hypothetical protein